MCAAEFCLKAPLCPKSDKRVVCTVFRLRSQWCWGVRIFVGGGPFISCPSRPLGGA